MTKRSALDALAEAGLEVDDLAAGVVGFVQITIEPDEPSEQQEEKLEEIRRGLDLFSTWKRCRGKERGFKERPEIFNRVYKCGKLEATILIVCFLGIDATFSVRRTK